MIKIPKITRWCYLLLLAFGCQQQATQESQQIEKLSRPSGIIRIGSISATIKEEIADFQPFADYLANHLHKHDIGHSKIIVLQTFEEMEEAIRKHQIDLYVDSPLPILIFKKQLGLQPFVRRWKKGRKSYHTVFFVHKDSPIQTLHDLKGHLVAFDEPHSTSGYLLPKATLVQAGLTLQKFKAFEDQPPTDSVRYIFSNDDENTLFWVLKKRVFAGVMDDDNFNTMTKALHTSFRIIHRSIDVPRHVIAHHPDLSTDLVSTIQDLLTQAHKTPDGRDMLLSFQRTAKFDDFEGDADKALADLTALLTLIESDLNPDP